MYCSLLLLFYCVTYIIYICIHIIIYIYILELPKLLRNFVELDTHLIMAPLLGTGSIMFSGLIYDDFKLDLDMYTFIVDCCSCFIVLRKTYIIYMYIYIGIVKNVSLFRCCAAAKYFAAKTLYPQLIFAAALLNFAAILFSTLGDPNSCGPMADGQFRSPKGRSYPHPKYWTHPWRIDINIGRGISPIESSEKNQDTWHIIQRHYYQDIIRRHYYQIAAVQWRVVHFGTPRVGPIHTPNIGPIDEGLISTSAVESHP